MYRITAMVILLTITMGSANGIAKAPKLEKGIYIFGGSGCIQVDEGGKILLFLPMGHSTGNSYEMKLRTQPKGDRLVLYGRLVKRADREGYVFPEIDKQAREWNPMVEIMPSEKTIGDWDLVYLHRLFYDLDVHKPTDFSKNPLVSFLHKLDDERVVEYFTYRKTQPADSQDPQWLFLVASTIVKNHTLDPFAHIFLMDALIEQKDGDGLAAEMSQWRKPIADINTLAHLARKTESSLRGLQYLKNEQTSRQNGYLFLQWLLSSQMDLSSRMDRLPEVLNCREYAEIFPLLADKFPNLLEVQVTAKTALVTGEFLMLQGKSEEALQVFASVYRLGQLMNQGGGVLNRLVGIAIRDIALKGLRVYALNSVTEPGEFANLRKSLDFLDTAEQEASTDDLFFLDPAGPYPTMISEGGIINALCRQKRADANFRLLRMAAAAKECLANSNALLSTREQLDSFLPKGIPMDPFSTSTLRFNTDPSTFTCYSVGPDRKDNHASVEYDPTNGSLSSGDIFIKVPRNRTFPFPRDGVRADTREELLRQFPNGLPPDPFADTRGKSLGVTNTTPVCIYSYGPDTNEHEEKKAQQEGREYYPEVLYDPTNGATSRGDLITVVRQ